MHLTGVIIKNSTLPEEELDSTDRNQSYPPTGVITARVIIIVIIMIMIM